MNCRPAIVYDMKITSGGQLEVREQKNEQQNNASSPKKQCSCRLSGSSENRDFEGFYVGSWVQFPGTKIYYLFDPVIKSSDPFMEGLLPFQIPKSGLTKNNNKKTTFFSHLQGVWKSDETVERFTKFYDN